MITEKILKNKTKGTEVISKSVVCLVEISLRRDFFMNESPREIKVKKRLTDCFPDFLPVIDSLPGTFNLNQVYGSVIAPLATSFGLMDFVGLPLHDSIWINKLYLTREIDIIVHYVENYNKPTQTYQAHRSFPDWTNVSMYDYPKSREIEFAEALTSMRMKNKLMK